jgi:hypothetical protein
MPFCLDNSYIYAFVKAIAEVNKLLTSPWLVFFSHVIFLIRIRLSIFILIWIPIQPKSKAKQKSRKLGLKTKPGNAVKFHFTIFIEYFSCFRGTKNINAKIAEHFLFIKKIIPVSSSRELRFKFGIIYSTNIL